MKKEPPDDSWIWKPGIDRLEDVWDSSASDPPVDEEPSVWAELGAVSLLDTRYQEKVLVILEKNRSWIEAYVARLPRVIRKQYVPRALSDSRWLNEENVLKRTRNRQRVAQQRAERRAKDLEGYREAEREARARRRNAERLREGATVSSAVRAGRST